MTGPETGRMAWKDLTDGQKTALAVLCLVDHGMERPATPATDLALAVWKDRCDPGSAAALVDLGLAVEGPRVPPFAPTAAGLRLLMQTGMTAAAIGLCHDCGNLWRAAEPGEVLEISRFLITQSKKGCPHCGATSMVLTQAAEGRAFDHLTAPTVQTETA